MGILGCLKDDYFFNDIVIASLSKSTLVDLGFVNVANLGGYSDAIKKISNYNSTKNKKCLKIIYEYNLKFNKNTYYNVQLSIF